MDDRSPAARFRRWRDATRACFLAGVGLCLSAPLGSGGRTTVGALLLGLTFLLYFRRCNRCPRCERSFSEAPAYASDDTSGLPLFGRIERCPFCAEPLDARTGA